MLERVFFPAFAHAVDPPDPHSRVTTPHQIPRQHRIFILSPKPISHNGGTRELRSEASALLRHEPDRPTSVPRLQRPTRYTDSLVQQCLRTRSRIPSPPLARLPLPRTVPRRSRRSRLESTQLRSSSYEHRGPDAIHPCLHDISITLRSLSHKTTTRLRGKGHSGLRTRQETTP